MNALPTKGFIVGIGVVSFLVSRKIMAKTPAGDTEIARHEYTQKSKSNTRDLYTIQNLMYNYV